MSTPLQVRTAAQWLADAVTLHAGLLVRRGLQILGVLLLAYAGFRMLKLLTHRTERAVDDGDPNTLTEREQRGRTLAQLLNSVGAVAIGLAAGLTILNFSFAIGPLLAGVGVAGLAVSFGAQSIEIPFPQRTLHLGGAEGLLSLFASRKDAAPAGDR